MSSTTAPPREGAPPDDAAWRVAPATRARLTGDVALAAVAGTFGVLVGVHVRLTTLGYALASRRQPLTQQWDLVTTAPWVLPAAAGLVLLVVAGVGSRSPS
jgi:ABC-type molybdate transport system permease subunit